MSKYIKLEDAIHNINLEVTGRKEYTGDMKANLFFALDDLPTIEVSEDCISKAYLEQEIENQIKTVNEEYWRGWNNALDKVVELIEDAPNVMPEPGKSEWIELGQDKDKTHNIRCKACGAAFKSRGHAKSFYTKERFRSCPGCGAKMRLE